MRHLEEAKIGTQEGEGESMKDLIERFGRRGYGGGYDNDPRWIKAKYAGVDADGHAFKKGEKVLYYPLGKRIFTGKKAEQAWKEFEAAKADERFMSGMMGEDKASMKDLVADLGEECKDPGKKRRSKGKGKGLAIGGGKGPIGEPKKEDTEQMASEYSKKLASFIVDEQVVDVLGSNEKGNVNSEAGKLAKKIASAIEKHMPPGHLQTCRFEIDRFDPKSGHIYIVTTLKNKSDWTNGIIQNDPALQRFFVYGFTAEGDVKGSLEVELSQGGILMVKADPGSHLAFGRVKLGWRKKKGTPDQIVKHFDSYFAKVAKIAKEKMNEEVELDESIGVTDRKVIAAFVAQKPMEGRKLSTDGKRLDGEWIGGRGIAEWDKGNIFFNDLGSNAVQSVQRLVKKVAGPGKVMEDVSLDEFVDPILKRNRDEISKYRKEMSSIPWITRASLDIQREILKMCLTDPLVAKVILARDEEDRKGAVSRLASIRGGGSAKKTLEKLSKFYRGKNEDVELGSMRSIIEKLGTSNSSEDKSLDEARQKMLTAQDLKKLPPLYSQENNKDPMAWVKFFNPYGAGTWFATEYDPKEELFFGYVMGLGGNELGYFSMRDLKSIRAERDQYWKPMKLSQAKASERKLHGEDTESSETVDKMLRVAYDLLGNNSIEESQTKNPKSMYDKVPKSMRPFTWSTPAPSPSGSIPNPWRVQHADSATKWMQKLFPQHKDIYVGTFGVDKYRGKLQMTVGLRRNDLPDHDEKLLALADKLGKHAIVRVIKRNSFPRVTVYLVDDKKRDELK